MPGAWKDEARRHLLRLRSPSGAWGYRAATSPAVEPTALAGLALRQDEPDLSRKAAEWLARLGAADGHVGVTEALAEPGWATPFALLLWAAEGGFGDRQAGAVAWLLNARGLAIPRTKDEVMGHDTSLIGWPWVAGTHSWVEPTALALLALGRAGRLDHPRAVEGAAVLRDRAIPSGGWNLGNPVVFGTVLRPLPGPTGLALLALARAGAAYERVVGPAITYLRSALPRTRAPHSLGWGVLGLRAWGAAPEAAEPWLAGALAHETRRRPTASSLALLLLAGDPRGLDALGVPPRTRRGPHA